MAKIPFSWFCVRCHAALLRRASKVAKQSDNRVYGICLFRLCALSRTLQKREQKRFDFRKLRCLFCAALAAVQNRTAKRTQVAHFPRALARLGKWDSETAHFPRASARLGKWDSETSEASGGAPKAR
jgi:hypothetical protein